MLQLHPLNINQTYACKCNPRNVAASPGVLKKDTVSFSGKEKDLLELSKKEIFRKIDASIKPENFLGEGGEAKVYKIEGTPYAVRLTKNIITNEIFPNYKKRLSFKLTDGDKINHTVALLGGEASIMKYIEGENCFKYKNQNELFNLPVDSYYKLYKQICHAKDKDMIFDCSSSNIIYNPKDKSLTALDFYKSDMDFPENTYPLSAIFSAFTTTTFAFQPENFKRLCAALLNIAIKEVEPGVQPVQHPNELSLGRLFRNFESCYEDSLPPQYDILKKTFYEALQLKYAESLGKDVKKELNGKIKLAKSLIKQVLLPEEKSILSKLKLWNYEF